MANIVFSLSRRQSAGNSEVRVRFYDGCTDQQTRTGIFVPTQHWSHAEGRCVISRRYETPTNQLARQAQQQLDNLATYILTQYQQQKPLGIPAKWLPNIVRQFHTPTPTAPLLSDIIEYYIIEKQIAPSTARKIRSLRSHLLDYARTHTPLTMLLTATDLQQFSAYLYNKGLARNSVSGRLRQLRTIIYQHGKPNPNPFDNFTIPSETYGTPFYLTPDELQHLATFPHLSPAKATQRDIFVFQCLVGCRVADLFHLTPANIQNGWLVYMPQKTTRQNPTTIQVPLTATAANIVERYKGVAKHNKLLPFLCTPQKYNNAIRAVCQQAQLTRPCIILDPHTFQPITRPLCDIVTSHTARKTFAQMIYTATGDRRLTASLTGHSENSQAFNRYSEVTPQMKLQAISHIPDKFPIIYPNTPDNVQPPE